MEAPLPGRNRSSPVLGPGEPPPSAQGSRLSRNALRRPGWECPTGPLPCRASVPPTQGHHQHWPFREGRRAASPPPDLDSTYGPQRSPKQTPSGSPPAQTIKINQPPPAITSPAVQALLPTVRSRYPPRRNSQSLPKEDSASTGTPRLAQEAMPGGLPSPTVMGDPHRALKHPNQSTVLRPASLPAPSCTDASRAWSKKEKVAAMPVGSKLFLVQITWHWVNSVGS